MRKTNMFALIQGFEFTVGPTECGQIVIKLTPREWEALPPWAKEFVVQADILLAREWARENTTIWRRVS